MKRTLTWILVGLASLVVYPSIAGDAQLEIPISTFNAAGSAISGKAKPGELRLRSFSVGAWAVGTHRSQAPGPVFALRSGFLPVAAPAAEVDGLGFDDGQALSWTRPALAWRHNLYRGLLEPTPAPGFGDCLQASIVDTSTLDAAEPPAGSVYFYLVTAENYLRQEGTRGFGSDGTERQGTACP